jgi:hypothetical protein
MSKTLEDASESIIAVADKALYEAKAQGRNTFCVYLPISFSVFKDGRIDKYIKGPNKGMMANSQNN